MKGAMDGEARADQSNYCGEIRLRV